MQGELVFVPLIGETPVPDWRKVAHIQVWGLALDSNGDQLSGNLMVLHVEGEDADLLTPGCKPLQVISLFSAEWGNVERNPTTVPPIVLTRMAELALTGEVSHD